MKRWGIILSILLCAVGQNALAQDAPGRHASVTAYLESLIAEPVDTIIVGVDRLIDSIGIQHPDLQSKVAGICFDFFTDSPVMGHEAISVHIADEWFLNGRLKLENDNLYPLIYTFAEFNRSSLVGKDAPSLRMEGIDSVSLEIRDISTPYKVLFFYDTECSTCRKEAPLLADIARSYQGEPLTIVAIYTQSDRKAWEDYVAGTFGGIDNPSVVMCHLSDPEAATGFHKKYGVLSTPMMFLIDSQNKIIGRGLDCEALAQMLRMQNVERLQYAKLFDNVFGAIDTLWYDDVEHIVDAFANRFKSDPRNYTDVIGHLYDYLRTSDYLPKQQGAVYLADNYIVREPDYWSQEFYDRTVHALAMARLNPVDSKATQLILQNKRGRNVKMIDKRHFYTLIFFHLLDCSRCQSELAQLEKLRTDFRELDIRVVLVYVGREKEQWKRFVKSQWPSHWTYLNDFKSTSNMRVLYDLEYVPHLYLLDSEGYIIAKDINANELPELFPFL